jgi:uncharacterized protein (TIGR02147 family)
MLIYDFMDYRAYITHQLDINGKVRGYKTQLAMAAGCKLSHLSQVLADKVQLTPEQAAGLSQFWKLERAEAEYFVGLVNLARAGTPSLRSLIRHQLEGLKREHQSVIGRLAPLVTQRPAEPHYYSVWYFGAIAMLTAIEEYQTLEALHQRLGLPRTLIERTLHMLVQMDVVEKVEERWKIKALTVIHSTRPEDRLAGHMTWRLKAMEYLANEKPSDLHYTGCVTVTHADAARIRELLLGTVEQFARITEKSEDEDCVTLLMDFFRI